MWELFKLIVAGRRQRGRPDRHGPAGMPGPEAAITDEEEGTRQRIEDTLEVTIEIMSSLADEMLRYKPETLMRNPGRQRPHQSGHSPENRPPTGRTGFAARFFGPFISVFTEKSVIKD